MSLLSENFSNTSSSGAADLTQQSTLDKILNLLTANQSSVQQVDDNMLKYAGKYGELFIPTLTSNTDEASSSVESSFQKQLQDILAMTNEISQNQQVYNVDPAEFLQQSVFDLIDSTNTALANQGGYEAGILTAGQDLWNKYASQLGGMIDGTDPYFQTVVQSAVKGAIAPVVSQSLQNGMPVGSTYATIAMSKAGNEAGASAANELRTNAIGQIGSAMDSMTKLQAAPYTGLLAAKSVLPTEYTQATTQAAGTNSSTSNTSQNTNSTGGTSTNTATSSDVAYQQPVTLAKTAQQSSGGGCCWIFLEARYGDGTMDSVVRKARDEYMTPRMRRGYYKLAEVLVPLMRRSRIMKFLVRATMTDPLCMYGRHLYEGNRIGGLFLPVKAGWFRLFEYLGDDHQFIRENGEVV